MHVDCDPGHPVDQLSIEPSADDTWIECRECGASNWMSKLPTRGPDAGKLLHRSRCRSRQQYVPGACAVSTKSPAKLDQEIDEALRDRELQKLAADVRRTGMTKGRDDDVVEAVRRGFLSVDDAMNTDD